MLMISIKLECFYFSEAAETLEVVVHAKKLREIFRCPERISETKVMSAFYSCPFPSSLES